MTLVKVSLHCIFNSKNYFKKFSQNYALTNINYFLNAWGERIALELTKSPECFASPT